MRPYITFTVALLVTLFSVSAQEITGIVTDNKKAPIISASVQVKQGSVLKGSAVTDTNGKYSVTPLDSGMYNITVSCIGYQAKTVKKVIVQPGKKVKRDFVLEPALESKTLTVTSYAMTQAAAAPVSVTYNYSGSSSTYTWGGNAAVATPMYRNPVRESYKKIQHNDFMTVASSPVSTMSVDVDRASYANVRRFITSGQKPPEDAVRVEEMINYFDYNYPQPANNDPVSFTTQVATCPWNNDHLLLHIGLQAKKINTTDLPASNLVFLVDVSGSMQEPGKLPLVQKGLTMLVDQLRKKDRISLVAYAGNAGLVLPSTTGDKKSLIKNAVNALEAGGSTAGGEGIMLAYKIAKQNFVKGGNNRVILCTDGDFNVGITENNDLENLITLERSTGIFLTCLGFGTGNYQDDRMEMLADKGNGNYNYIDNEQEAEKTLVKEFGGTIFTVAKDVKCQLEFNPAIVKGYRLIGYENRLLNTEDFKDDKKDAGDMGSGHTVTVLYEIVPVEGMGKDLRPVNTLKYQHTIPYSSVYTDELATLKLRYKQPADSVSKELTHVVRNDRVRFANASENVRYAASVAMFGLLLRNDKHANIPGCDKILDIARSCDQKDEYHKEFIALVAARANMSEKKRSK